MFDVVPFLLLGSVVGIATGLIPGFHPNLIATLAASYAFFTPVKSSVFLVSAGVTNTFVNFIPAVYLGAPSASTALSVLPGHKMLMEGRGYEAIRLTVVGGLISVAIVVAIFPVFVLGIDPVYSFLSSYMPLVLLSVVAYMVWKDRRLDSVGFFVLSGLLGYVVLEHNIVGTQHDLFPLLSGLFGIPMLIHSFRKKPSIPTEDRSIEHIDRREAIREGTLGSLAGVVVGLLPGIGSAQATYLVRELEDDESDRGFMLALGGVNTSNILVSLLAIYLIGRGRSGVAVSVQNIMDSITLNHSVLFIIVGIVAAGIGAYATLKLARSSLVLFRKADYSSLCLGVIVFILLASLVLTGTMGLVVALVATSIGFSCLLSGSRRSYLMGSILFPIIIFML